METQPKDVAPDLQRARAFVQRRYGKRHERAAISGMKRWVLAIDPSMKLLGSLELKDGSRILNHPAFISWSVNCCVAHGMCDFIPPKKRDADDFEVGAIELLDGRRLGDVKAFVSAVRRVCR